MEFDNNSNQHLVSRCPFCGAEYDLDGAKVIGEEDDSTMVYVACAKCESSIIAIVAMSGLGVVSLGLVTDMSKEDTDKFLKGKEVTSNELLDMYQLFKENKGEVFKQLTNTDK